MLGLDISNARLKSSCSKLCIYVYNHIKPGIQVLIMEGKFIFTPMLLNYIPPLVYMYMGEYILISYDITFL